MPKAQAKIYNFDAGKSTRRLRGIPTAQAAINTQIATYGKTIVARSRYLCSNNTYGAAAKESFITAVVGDGITPSLLLREERELKEEIQLAWNDWVDEADADGIGDFYGLQQLIAGEIFEAGEVFIRMRPRKKKDGLTVPLQLQVLPSEMLDLAHNEVVSKTRHTIEMGIEFDRIGKRVAYHFFRRHPDSAEAHFIVSNTEKVRVPANQILHLYRRQRAGQIRGIPESLPSITRLAILDAYDDAELERKRSASLFCAFVIRPALDDSEHPFASSRTPAPDDPEAQQLQTDRDAAGLTRTPADSWAMEPAATIDLEEGEDVRFAAPADVGGNYEAFQFRNLLAISQGFGLPYSAVTGDLTKVSFSSVRQGTIESRRRISAIQKRVMTFQFCKPVWRRWINDASLAGAIPVSPVEMTRRKIELNRVRWMPPKWEWVDPLKDRQAEKIAVDNGWKSRSDVIEAEGGDPVETDNRIAADKERAEELGLTFGEEPPEAPDEEQDENDEDDDNAQNSQTD